MNEKGQRVCGFPGLCLGLSRGALLGQVVFGWLGGSGA